MKRSIIAFTCSGTSSWWKWPAPTVTPTSRSGLIARNRSASVLVAERRAEQQRRNGTERERARRPFQSLTLRITAAAIGSGTAAHQFGDPAGQLLVTGAHVLDPETTDLLAARALQLLGGGVEELHGLRQRVDRARVDENESARQRRVSRPELDRDHPAEAVPDDDRLLDRRPRHRTARGRRRSRGCR